MSFDDDDFDDRFDDPRLLLEDNGATTEIADNDLIRREREDSPFPTDFEEMLARRAESKVGPDGQPMDDLSQMLQEQEFQRESLVKLAPNRRINPESAYRGMLGGQQTINPGDDVKEVVRWIGEDIEACPVSIMCYPLSPMGTANPIFFGTRAFIQIEFGSRDGLAKVEVDICRGKQLTLPASVVYVKVGLDTGSGTPYRLAAAISFYTITRTAPLIRTLYRDSLEASTTVSFTVPAFAGNVWLERSVVGNQMRLDFLDDKGTTLYTRVIAANTYLVEPVIIANDVQTVSVTNQGGSTSSVRAMFGLVL